MRLVIAAERFAFAVASPAAAEFKSETTHAGCCDVLVELVGPQIKLWVRAVILWAWA